MPSSRKSTQRERLIAGMIAVADRDEYAGASVSAVVAQAKVSKPTFYEYFRDRSDCFIAALNSVHTRLLTYIGGAISDAPQEHAATAGVRAILEFASSEPVLTRFMTAGPLGGGSGILDARDECVAEIADAIEDRVNESPPEAAAPDLPVVVVIGGLYRLLAARARRGQRLIDSEAEDLLRWIDEYNVPHAERRWHTLQPSRTFAPFPDRGSGSLRAPEPLPPGRPTLSEADVAANQRLRIIFAAGSIATEKGYAAVTITEIAKLAQVDLGVFYSLFATKQDVFFAAQEHGFQEGLAVAAAAYFAGATWPERLWAAGAAFHRFLEANPHFARFGFIESYAAGRNVAQRNEEGSVTFTLLLQEGLQFSSKPTLPTPVVTEALIACNFEHVYRQLRTSDPPKLIEFVPNIASLWLTPFLGPSETNRFVDEQTRAGARPGRNRGAGY